MKTVQKIIDQHGGIDALKKKYIRIENPPYMVLCIEYVGTGPRGLPMVSVCHYYEQNGDQMKDPDMVFEVGYFNVETDPIWNPIEYQQDGLNIFQRAVWTDPNHGQVMIDLDLVRDLRSFAKTWDRNLKEQGFAKVKATMEVI